MTQLMNQMKNKIHRGNKANDEVKVVRFDKWCETDKWVMDCNY